MQENINKRIENELNSWSGKTISDNRQFNEELKKSFESLASYIKSETLKEVENLPTTFPEKESDDYDAGYLKAKNDILEIIKETK